MGLALPALSRRPRPARRGAQPRRPPRRASCVVLAILAPVATARLEDATDRAILQGASLVLDAQIDPLKKLELAPGLLDDVDVDRPRAALREAVDARRAEFASDAAVYDRLAGPARRRRGRRDPGRVPDRVPDRRRARARSPRCCSSAPGGGRRSGSRPRPRRAASSSTRSRPGREAPPEVVLADPCRERPLPETGGITGAIQQQALKAARRGGVQVGIDARGARAGALRPDPAREFEERYGVDPRSTIPLLSLLGG